MKTVAQRTREAGRHRIFVLDDHPITRYGVVQLINDEPDLKVCGEADTVHQALNRIHTSQADLILLDITLPDKSGLDFLKDIQTILPGITVLVVSMHDETIYAERVLRAGARGYIMKSEGGSRLLEAIRQVLRGHVYVSPRMSAMILDSLTRKPDRGTAARPSALTDREFEVFQLIGQGLSTREIGERLNLGVKTIGTHRLHIKTKLKLENGAALIREAVRWAAAQQLI